MAAVGVLFEGNSLDYHYQNAPVFAENMTYVEVERKHEIRVFDKINSRYIYDDFFAKLALRFDKNE